MVVAALMATMTVQAQNEDLKNEIGVSYGLGVSLIGDGLGNGLGNLLGNMSGYKYENDSQFGSLSVEYFRHLNGNPKLAFGGIFSYSRYGEDVYKDGSKVGDRNRNYYTLMPAMKYSWINKHHFALCWRVPRARKTESRKTTPSSISWARCRPSVLSSAVSCVASSKLVLVSRVLFLVV